MNKNRLVRITALFLVMMLCFTILSRAADQAGTAAVQVAKPDKRMITHEVRTTGKAVQNQELAVTTEPDQRVTAIEVSSGQRVKKGDLLFTLDTDVIREKILRQKQEMQKQELQTKDYKSQNAVSAQQKANEQASASEQYSLSTGRANAQLSRAKRELQKAKKALADFQNESGISPEDGTVEDSLERNLEARTNDYLQAEQELVAVQWKIENAVNTALQNAKSGASLLRNETVHTKAAEALDAEHEPELILEDTGSDGGLLPERDAGAAVLDSQQNSSPEAAQNEADGDLIIENVENMGAAGGTGTADNTGSIEHTGGAGNTENAGTAGGVGNAENTGAAGGDGSGAEVPGQNTPPTQEELRQVEQSVRESFRQELSKAQEKVDAALADKDAAEQALSQYRQERLAASDVKSAEEEKQLIANIEAAQDGYEDAARAANEAAVTSGRAVQTAGIPNASNSSVEMNEITYEQMELELEKLEKLQSAGGRICAPSDGLVTAINIRTGEKTTDTTAILMADLSKGYRFTAELTKEQEKYIGAGDEVTLTDSKKRKYEGLAVESVTEDEENQELYHVSVQLPEDTLELGAAATLEYSRKSESYPICVPLSALHLDEKNQPYVLVYDEHDSVLGKELRARKVGVTVQEQNESYAALAQGTISAQDQVIISSDKAVDDGSRIRIAE